MKQAIPALKLPILVLLLLAVTSSLSAQDCYQTFFEEGKNAFEAFQFEKAIKKFEAAIVCSDRPASSDAEEWLAKAQNGYIDRLQLIASKYLTSEGQRAFQKSDYRLAFRLYQEALKYKKDNAQAKELQEELLPYMADYQYGVKIDPRFYSPDQVTLYGDGSLVVFDENKENKKPRIKLINPDSRAIIKSFELAGSPSNYQFSKDGKWLAIEYFDPQKQEINLSLWDTGLGQKIQTFDKIFRSDAYKAFTFSKNGEKLVFRTEEIIERISAITMNDEVVADTLREMGYSLNVFDLPTQKVVFSSGAIIDYFSNSPDADLNIFRGSPMRQDLINEKIAMKFSTNGVISTNNQNFVLKENEFRIRESYDFAISPDGKKFAFHEYGEELQTELNFSSEVSITIGPRPMTLIGIVKVFDLESNSLVLSAKSDYKELPQRFLPFSFDNNSDNLIFINNQMMTGLEYNEITSEWESTNTTYDLGFNIYNFDKKAFQVENKRKIIDYWITQNNSVITWSGKDAFVDYSGKIEVIDLNTQSLVFSKIYDNDFSHFYNVKAEGDLIYFSTFDLNNSKTELNILDAQLDTITTLKYDFPKFKYTYLRTSSDRQKVAFLTDNGTSIDIWDVKSGKNIRTLKNKYQIKEFDFSNDSNYLIIRNEGSFIKIVDLRISNKIYDYFDNYFEQLTVEERKKNGIDW